ncbi:abortive infection family protein [Rhodococcus opacus]|uniref:Abortive infection family protein n=1 Tax=Rhodococcus opacus TaxID=37919 RepID=A0AAX3YRX5_RHOOP|nr:abortive infection family protein [Rhodococcus opacus]MCZ4590425.1 abortive infection family protein [Rhodococcus opacus]WLF51255.1 abortive infection family protein [Rhodococcus opacus]
MPDLVSKGTRGRFRDLATDSTVNVIATAFQDEGFAPNYESTYVDSSVRRQTAQHHMESVNWADEEQVARALRAIERIIEDFDQQYTSKFWTALEHDGYRRDPDTKRLLLRAPRSPFADETLSNLTDPSVIKSYLDRLHGAVDTDPELAIGSAKELIESTAKVVLNQLGVTFTKDDTLVQLATRAQESLRLHPKQAKTDGPDGSTGIKSILGGALGIATGVAELRNAYGTGHGRDRRPKGLGPRHAHLAANAAFLWCQLMLDTLADPKAPWRRNTE